jgi:hypothetical protein
LHVHDDTGVVSGAGDAADLLGAGGLLALCLAGALFAGWRAFAAALANGPPAAGRSAFTTWHPLPLDRPPRG